MGLEVEEFENCEKNCAHCIESIIGPCWWSIVWSQEEIHCEKTEQDEVMEAIFEDVRERHGIIRELMDEQCLQFTLQVVTNSHCNTKLLVIGKLRI